MELKAHFSDIHSVIIDHLQQSKAEIRAAVAWFTDRDIFEVLCTKSRAGIRVSVALIGDDINQGPGGLNFQKLRALGGHVTFLPAGSRDAPVMHHKFCVIDRSTVITGSYNWSRKARSNDENITVVTGSTEFAARYLDTFGSLIDRVGHTPPVAADAEAVRRRLEMIRNLILLGEQDDIATHVHRLRPVADAVRISPILAALENGEFRAALGEIDAYLSRATALVAAGYADIPGLRFQLGSLELRLESLTDEKAELERSLITFNRRHNDALGDVIHRLLRIRAELALLLVTERKSVRERQEAESAARDAEDANTDYAEQYEALQRTRPVPVLDEEAERELKSLYRRACSLCHPDKVTEGRKEAAHRVFVGLQDAYKSNDLNRVREIHETLRAGGLPETRSTTLSETEALRAAIAEMEYAIGRLVAELKVLEESDGVRLMRMAGATETQWQAFFEQQLSALGTELAQAELELHAKHSQKEHST